MDISESRRKAVTTAALLLSTALVSLDVTVLSVAMPTIVGDLAEPQLYGWVFSSYLLASTATVPVYGQLADKMGRRWVYVAGMTIFLVGSIACSFCTSLRWLVLARLIQGLGAGALTPLTYIILGDLYVAKVRARVMTIFSLVWGVSSFIGPGLGAFVLHWASWPAIFLLNLPVGLFGAVVFLSVFKESHTPTKKGVAALPSLLVVIAVGSFIAVLTYWQDALEVDHVITILAGLCICTSAVFVFVERRSSSPLLSYGMLRSRPLLISILTGLTSGGLLFCCTAFFPPIVLGLLQGSPTDVSFVLVSLSLGWTGGAAFSGPLFGRLGYRAAIIVGGLLIAVSSVLLLPTIDAKSLGMMILASAILGIGFGLFFNSSNIMVQDLFPWRQRGAATAWVTFSRNMGGAVFVAVVGAALFSTMRDFFSNSLDAQTIGLLLAPENWAHLEPPIRERAASCLETSIPVVATSMAVLGVLVGVGSFFFPAIHVAQEPTAPDDGV